MSCMNQEPEGIGRIDNLPAGWSSFYWSSRIVVPEEDLDDGLEDDLEAGVGEWAKVVRDGHPIAFGEADQMWNNLLPLFVSAEVTQEGRNDLVLVDGIGDVWWSNSSTSLCVRQILVLTPIEPELTLRCLRCLFTSLTSAPMGYSGYMSISSNLASLMSPGGEGLVAVGSCSTAGAGSGIALSEPGPNISGVK